MKNKIKDLAATTPLPWGTIAEKIDENFSELEGAIPSLEGLATEKQLANKQDVLKSGENLKTINGKSLLGKGNIQIEGGEGTSAAVNYDLNVKAVNHRGYSMEAPENTIPAYIMSKTKGFTYVEGDVAFTSDDVAVLLHDATIDRTSDGSGNIGNLAYQEVLQYDFGSWFSAEYAGVKIPTFKEWIICCKNLGLHPYIELKSSGSYTQAQITQIVNEVEECGMKGKVTYISFNNTFLGYVKNADASARLGLLANPLNASKISQAVALKTSTNEVFMDAKLSTVTSSLITSLRNNDLPLEVWTVNTEAEILSMPSYVSGVTSDNIIAGKVLYDNALVYVPPTSAWVPTTAISLDKTSFTFSSFDVITLVATIEPSNSSEEVEWKSSDTSVAIVANGVVTPLKNGSCTITATSGDYSATCAITVALATYNIVRNLQYCSIDNTSNSAMIGTSWSGTITPENGYSLKNATIQITMGGVDITSSSYSNGVITIKEVTGDVSIKVVCVAVPVYTITRNLVGCTSNSSITSIGEGNPHTETIAAQGNYTLEGATVSITMGGVDISSNYSNGVLTISEVTGNIVISITAVASYSITRNLVGCTSSSNITSIIGGQPHTETFSKSTFYTIESAAVTMGGVDISGSLVDNVLTIERVTGDIVITITGSIAVAPVVDLQLKNVTNGVLVNKGSGGNAYDATVMKPKSTDSYESDENGLRLNNHAYANTPFGFSASQPFTILIKARITKKSSNTYQRVFRTEQDKPCMFYSKNSEALGAKLNGTTGNGNKVYNELAYFPSNLNTCYLSYQDEGGFDESIMREYIHISDGTTIKWYVDGVLMASQNASALVTSSLVGLGDNDTSKDYYASQIEVAEFKLWNSAMSLE